LKKLKIRSIINCFQELVDTPSKTYKKSVATTGEQSVSRVHGSCFLDITNTSEKKTLITDKEGRGRKKNISQTLLTSVAYALENDRRDGSSCP